MKTNGINIRDPFVLAHGGKYYMYGTRSATCWGPADGFDCYVSADLEDWEGPVEIFRRPVPNDRYQERPRFLRAVMDENGLRLAEG